MQYTITNTIKAFWSRNTIQLKIPARHIY